MTEVNLIHSVFFTNLIQEILSLADIFPFQRFV